MEPDKPEILISPSFAPHKLGFCFEVVNVTCLGSVNVVITAEVAHVPIEHIMSVKLPPVNPEIVILPVPSLVKLTAVTAVPFFL